MISLPFSLDRYCLFMSSIDRKALCIFINFLSSGKSSYIVYFKNSLEYLSRETTQVFFFPFDDISVARDWFWEAFSFVWSILLKKKFSFISVWLMESTFCYHYIIPSKFFHSSVFRWTFIAVWIRASLLRSQSLFSVFRLIVIII